MNTTTAAQSPAIVNRRRINPDDVVRCATLPWDDRQAVFGCPAACHHGTMRCYGYHGCRCPDARAANSRVTTGWRHRRLAEAGRGYVDGTRSRRQVQALRVIGHRPMDVSRALGCDDTLASHILRQKFVQLKTAQRLDRLYGQLAGHPGPGVDPDGRPSKATLVARRARTETVGFTSPVSTWTPVGYPPPWAWNRIDMADPAATPWHYDWDTHDPAIIERILRRARGLWTPTTTLTAGQAAAAIGHILLTVPEPAAALHRVFDRAHRHCTRVVTAGGVRTTAAREWAQALRDQPLPLSDRDVEAA